MARVAAAALSAPAAAVWTYREGWVASQGQENPPDDARRLAAAAFAGAGPCASLLDPDEAPEPLRWCVASPIGPPGGRTVGALCVFDRAGRQFSPQDAATLADIGCLLAEAQGAGDADGGGPEARRLRVLFDALLDNTDALVFIKRRSGELIAANRVYRVKAMRESVVGATDDVLYGPTTASILRATDSAIFETGESFYGEERVTLPDGTEATYLSSKFLIHDPSLGEEVLCAISTDITEQKALQARLEASRREAEAANVAKSEFLAAMSHEIRTPMNGVLGMLALLVNTELDARQKRMATVARDSAAGLLGLLNDILDYARITTSQSPASRQLFNLRAAIASGCAPHRDTMRRKGIELSESMDPSLPEKIVGDPSRFRQVLGALVGNAAKFTETGRIAVTATFAPGAQGFVRISVADTGVGVAESMRERIFLGFAQGDGSHTRRYGGVGLGLSIARHMVDSMGGAMGLESVEGEGATFWFTAPIAGPQTPPFA